MKEKEIKKIKCLLIIFISIILTFAILNFIININQQNQINKIEDIEKIIEKIPKEICYNETITEKRIIEPDESFSSLLQSGIRNSCSTEFDNKEIICEEGITVYECLGVIVNWNDKPGVCLIKYKNKICEIK